MLSWLNSEKSKDQKELDKEKEKFVRQIKGLKKEDIFPKPVKLSLWKRIKILILGN